ncbi:cell division protein FtsB [Spongiibacter sp. KMU-158]|uniref:Cell division protein FtsB n=1 Tax=Spongiibacter pelagi TaxID=2760804 RepID=A0A927C4N4_9GAMM|nr:cell division protein FtsB [Spongiibacter pelagi]
MTRRRLLFLLLIMLAYLQYRLWFGPGSWEQVVSLNREIAHQQQENQKLQTRNDRLAGEVESLKTDLDSIEEKARNDMGLVKKGETFYRVVEPEK